MAKIKHKDQHDKVTNFKKRNGEEWDVKGKKLKLTKGETSIDFDDNDLDIEEDDLTQELTCNGSTIPFCPRGWYVDDVWCPMAIMVFAVLETNPSAVIKIYDEVM